MLYYCEDDNWVKESVDAKGPKLCAYGCERMPDRQLDRCNADPSDKFIFPFEDRNDVWEICQGYNSTYNSSGQPVLTHNGNQIYAFDFAYGTGNLGSTGCLAEEAGNDSRSEDKFVVAPAAGTIAWVDPEMTCINLQNLVSNGHGTNIASVMLGHMKSDENRVEKGAEVSQKERIGILSGRTVQNGKYAHVHMSAYATVNCGSDCKRTGDCDPTSVPFGTAFLDYGTFSSNGNQYQWHGEEIPVVATCPSGNGLYCGSAVSRDVNTLFRCTDGEYVPEQECDNGCENNSCIPVPESCPDSTSLYCGQSSLGLNTNYLYYCQNGSYQLQEPCIDGCETIPGEDDKCKDIALTVVYSVSPKDAVLGKSTIFTVSGDSLPSTLEFTLEGCTSVQSLGGTSVTQRFSCIPGITGQKEGEIQQTDGTSLKTFTVDVSGESGNSPVVYSVTTTGATVGKLSYFTVNGKDLPFTVKDEDPSSLQFILNDCKGVTSLGGSSTAMRFSCTPYTAGQQIGIIEQSGAPLKTFTIDVSY